jgi:carnitine O-acetyltransferase
MSSSSSLPSHYDSHGDYQADDASGNFLRSREFPLYEHQDSLPRLPVNSIADTIEKLKPSCLALISNQTDKTTNKERDHFLDACKAFPQQAEHLQRLLEERAQTEDNWLQSWWNRIGYLGVRDPSPINVNYIFNFPKAKHSTKDDSLGRGARLLHSVYAFSESIRSGDLPQDRFGKQQTALCSSMYKYLFYSCRIPKHHQDVYRIYHCKYYNEDGSRLVVPKHAVVSAKGHYFSVDLTDPTEGRPYSVSELELALQACVKKGSSLGEDTGSAANTVRNLGLLTTTNRDEWAANRNVLIDRIHGMRDALHRLESGLVLLCLDERDDDSKFQPVIDSLSQNSRSYLMGTQGRWYDKSIQFILTNTGNLGLNGEHSMMDGMPVVGLQNYILKQELEAAEEPDQPKGSPDVNPIFACPAILDQLGKTKRETIDSMKDKAASGFDTLRSSLDLEVQSFRGYGAEWIKKHGKCSPDAYMQMAIQLAMGKLFTTAESGGKPSQYIPRATYESTQVRPFKYGRTETTRSVSAQSVEWVEAMLNRHRNSMENEIDRTKLLRTLFHKATDAHVDYMRKASKGLGVDRHLFGLQMILSEQQQLQESDDNDTPTVALFEDPLFVRSKQWLVSTSTLPSNPGFGPVVIPEGVGVAYDVKAHNMYFTCTSYKGSAPALSHYLEESLLEMQELMIADKGFGRSKL